MILQSFLSLGYSPFSYKKLFTLGYTYPTETTIIDFLYIELIIKLEARQSLLRGFITSRLATGISRNDASCPLWPGGSGLSKACLKAIAII